MLLYCWSCDFQGLKLSQCKVRRINRWGGTLNHILMAYLASNICTKNYWNPTTIVEVIVGDWVVSFFWDTVHVYTVSRNIVTCGEIPNVDGWVQQHITLQELSSCWGGRPFGHNRHGPKVMKGCCGGWVPTGPPSTTMWPGPRPTTLPSGILIHPTVWP